MSRIIYAARVEDATVRASRAATGVIVERLWSGWGRRRSGGPRAAPVEPTTHYLLPTHALILISQALNNTFTDAHFSI